MGQLGFTKAAFSHGLAFVRGRLGWSEPEVDDQGTLPAASKTCVLVPVAPGGAGEVTEISIFDGFWDWVLPEVLFEGEIQLSSSDLVIADLAGDTYLAADLGDGFIGAEIQGIGRRARLRISGDRAGYASELRVEAEFVMRGLA